METAAIIGYGRMGRAIEALWLEAKKKPPLIIESRESLLDELDEVAQCDISFEFTSPKSALGNLEVLASKGLSVVCGSTGWLEAYDRVCRLFESSQGTFFYASNFSPGMNMMFWLAQKMGRWNRAFSELEVSVEEVHHVHKVDSPSGTAIHLAEAYLSQNDKYQRWELKDKNHIASPDVLPVSAYRRGEVYGDHTLTVKYPMERLSFKHEALDRRVFARGAMLAADYVQGKKGIYRMSDLLDLDKNV